jgi:hypothetical protein
MAHGQPIPLERDNDGSYLFRVNIEPEMDVPIGKEEEEQIGWKCYEVRVWSQPTKAALKKALIRSVVDETAEFDMVNSYNKHVLGVKVDETAVDEYKEFLQFTEEIDDELTNY